MDILRRLFEAKVYKSNGMEFQRLFETVMTYVHGDVFMPIKPYGGIGDGGNDGWIPSTGTYFQVYGPETITGKSSAIKAKILNDFTKLMQNWNDVVPIREYIFVCNDKGDGFPSSAGEAIAEIANANRSISAGTWGSLMLEKQFLQLPQYAKEAIVGYSSGNTFAASKPAEVSLYIETLVRTLNLNYLPLINENLMGYFFDVTLWDGLDNVYAKLQYIELPQSYAALKLAAENFINSSKVLKIHYDTYQYCEMQPGGVKKTKSWKQTWIQDQSIYKQLSDANEKWEQTNSILLNNFCVTANKLLAQIRLTNELSFLAGYFAMDSSYTVPTHFFAP